ncbi:MAG: HAMP domain-containing histidine kinase [Tannerellaceae bacterium]|nr:HAMP domain-containing histidine kinase [Tannerellaceae bacterium]
MKLVQYIYRNLYVPLLILLTIWAYSFQRVIIYEINDETNTSLRNYKNLIIKEMLSDPNQIKDHADVMNRHFIREIPAEEADVSKDEIYDSVTYIEIEDEYQPVRVLRTSFLATNGIYYELTIEMSTVEKDDLIRTVWWSILILYTSLVCCILLVTHQAFKKSFLPLFNIMEWLKKYHPGKPVPPLENETVIEEFEILNSSIAKAAKRSSQLYFQQKQFVENAAHELQTPLAVCINKLELLSENPDCTEEQLLEIADLNKTIQRIVKLNKSLLLLSRIDNDQFPDTKMIRINDIVKTILYDFEDIFQKDGPQLQLEEKQVLTYQMNEALAFTLLSNLIKNAYLYTPRNGKIHILIDQHTVLIENFSGDETPLDTDQLFERFHKNTKHHDSTGLGLAIVKSIAQLYHIQIKYTFRNGHQFFLTFP